MVLDVLGSMTLPMRDFKMEYIYIIYNIFFSRQALLLRLIRYFLIFLLSFYIIKKCAFKNRLEFFFGKSGGKKWFPSAAQTKGIIIKSV